MLYLVGSIFNEFPVYTTSLPVFSIISGPEGTSSDYGKV